MEIILTHEMADFDAVASLLAVYLLNKNSIPVLPNKINRNVRAFLTLFGANLPFVEMKDLPNRGISAITIVDSQTLQSIRGVDQDVRVYCVDHHPIRSDFPENWTSVIQFVGATVTILVEKLQEQNQIMDPIQASLLLLGIYEDTGSMMYSRTHPRDLIAAAFLLTMGADISKVDQFLRHPLSADQQNFYTELVRSAEMLNVKGENICIVRGTLEQDDMELSILAHKLRDWFEPSALFLLVDTRSGVQFIARSNSDYVNVAAIAEEFGGGGHARASAALIRTKNLDEVYELLKLALIKAVKPAVRVGQIMSFGMQTLLPETLASKAKDLMQRFGFEGYPVVRENRVLGLLTRRAVDRALSHKLNLPASSLMNPGNFVVYPEDSLDVLRQTMIESGWGQIPVVDPDGGHLLGIVTRTDFIQAIGFSTKPGLMARNFAQKMDQFLPEERLALIKAVAQVAVMQGLHIYVVGGFVRDLLLEHPSLDFDIVVEGDAIQLAQHLVREYGGNIKTHDRFGTAKWYLPKGLQIVDGRLTLGANPQLFGSNPQTESLPFFLDLVTARTEFYTSPSALPTVERASIKLDLHRRDFTINTLALRLDGNHFGDLLDYWGGVSDLEQGTIRVLHSLSFIDDPTRILRAVRFEQRFGFQIEERTLQLLHGARDLMDKLSGDRIRHELEHALLEKSCVRIIDRLQEFDLLTIIHPALTWDSKLAGIFQDFPLEESNLIFDVRLDEIGGYSWGKLRQTILFGVWLAGFSKEDILAVAERLHLPQMEIDHILSANTILTSGVQFVESTPSVLTAFLDNFSLIAVLISGYLNEDIRLHTQFERYLKVFRFIVPHFSGDDIRSAGIKPGPVYREILQGLRNRLLDGEIKSLQEEETEFINLVSRQQKG